MGFTLSPVDDPDHEQTHEPSACRGCGAGLDGATVVGVERRQVFDLPPLRLEVTEHRLISRARSCGVITKARAPAGVNAPVQYGSRLAGVGVYLFHGQFLSKSRTCQALAEVFGAKIAASTLVSWVKRIAAGSLQWMHSASTPTEVLVERARPTRGERDGRRWRSPAVHRNRGA